MYENSEESSQSSHESSSGEDSDDSSSEEEDEDEDKGDEEEGVEEDYKNNAQNLLKAMDRKRNQQKKVSQTKVRKTKKETKESKNARSRRQREQTSSTGSANSRIRGSETTTTILGNRNEENDEFSSDSELSLSALVTSLSSTFNDFVYKSVFLCVVVMILLRLLGFHAIDESFKPFTSSSSSSSSSPSSPNNNINIAEFLVVNIIDTVLNSLIYSIAWALPLLQRIGHGTEVGGGETGEIGVMGVGEDYTHLSLITTLQTVIQDGNVTTLEHLFKIILALILQNVKVSYTAFHG